MSLMPVEEAQARLLALAKPLPREDAPLLHCNGRWLASDVMALRDQPFTDLSAMDGYAVQAGSGPWRVTQESAAGGPVPQPLAPGQAARIFTGAPVPVGADAILIQENAERDADLVRCTTGNLLKPGLHLRPQGSDFKDGEVLLRAGSQLGPAQLGLAALAGHGTLPVHRRPRIAILSTGNELVAPGAPIPVGKLPSSNSVMLAAMLQQLPCEISDVGIIADDLDAMKAAFDSVRHFDLIISTGGASVGDHDLVRPAFAAAGGTLDFWKIRMRPGKPLMAGTLDGAIFLGLPGNPVSAFVTATLFVKPLISHLCGSPTPLPRFSSAPLARDLGPTGERDDYLRARMTPEGAVALTAQDSAATRALADANCLIVRPAGSEFAARDSLVTILPL
ncbi:MAG: molybdopterin molybdotransferase MoeA [Sphingobium sp.]|uniref:molybdopterin molybdotransferase MoeA n=1 Tax=Sphingobium sp. TaxID=1912891 RepID=UPI0029A217D2|nr:gephyrin-like molybdotransferase Glp [Sphingobium sp.]MDX3910511.1 molybdopterin molybdotransferase MoeA [Sphingobium sp.]